MLVRPYGNFLTADARNLPLVAVLGATGTGKSALALTVAEAFGGEIVNCDSLQVYRHFDVGTAKLSAADQRGIPHHLIDIADPDEVFTAGEYAGRAREVLTGISARGRLPVIAGGTGFYLRALLDGLFEGPSRNQPLRDRLSEREKRRPGSLHRLLGRFDSEAAVRIHRRDIPKVTRALEICLLARRPASEMFRTGRNALLGYRTFKVGLCPNREMLYQRLDLRCQEMFDAGLVDEVRRILALGFSPASKPFESHGYKQALQLLAGELTLSAAVADAQRNTRRYAKRQMTWFRREADVEWLAGFGEDPHISRQAVERAGAFLNEKPPGRF